MRSPTSSRSPNKVFSAGLMIPTAEPPSTTRPASISEGNTCVSPPPQETRHSSQAAAQPWVRSRARSASENQAPSPAPQYAVSAAGFAPTLHKSFKIVATVSRAMAS
jgi:hypothetical protein